MKKTKLYLLTGLMVLSIISITACANNPSNNSSSKGTVKSIVYESKDYTNDESITVKKPAYIYLPPYYDENDPETNYPVLYLMHGIGGNETEWGMTSSSSSIAQYMNKGIAKGEIKPFIIVCPVGRSTTNYTDASFDNMASFYVFGKELRNDLIPYMEANYNVETNRDGRAMAGLSMGGMQTINIGMCECLDIISWFGAFSAAPTSYEKEKVASIITSEPFTDYSINYFYNICGLQDSTAWDSHSAAAKNIDTICSKFVKYENYYWKEKDGYHNFDIWNLGFKDFAKIAFKK